MLVRMMKDGQPKYVRADDIVDIGWADDDHECGACTVTYKDGGFAVVDGTPDEVFRALLNPPEMVLKEDVEKAMRTVESLLSEASRGRGSIFGAERFIADIRDSLGLGKRR